MEVAQLRSKKHQEKLNIDDCLLRVTGLEFHQKSCSAAKANSRKSSAYKL